MKEGSSSSSSQQQQYCSELCLHSPPCTCLPVVTTTTNEYESYVAVGRVKTKIKAKLENFMLVHGLDNLYFLKDECFIPVVYLFALH